MSALGQRTLVMCALQTLGQKAYAVSDDAWLASLSEAWERAGLGLQWFASDVVYDASYNDAIERIDKARRGRHRRRLEHQADAILRMIADSPLKASDWNLMRWAAMNARANGQSS